MGIINKEIEDVLKKYDRIVIDTNSYISYGR